MRGWANWFLCDERRSATTNDEDKIFRTAPRFAGVLNEKLNQVLAGQRSLYRLIGSEADADYERDAIIMSALTDALDTLEANTTKIDGAADSAEAAFTRLAAMIADLKANTTDPATIDRINALSTALSERATQLGAAVEATPT